MPVPARAINPKLLLARLLVPSKRFKCNKRQSSKKNLEHVRLAARSVSPTNSVPTSIYPFTVQASARANTTTTTTLDEDARLKLILELQKRYLQKTLGDRHVDKPMPYVPSVPSLQPNSCSHRDIESIQESNTTMGGVAKHHIYLQKVSSNEHLQ